MAMDILLDGTYRNGYIIDYFLFDPFEAKFELSPEVKIDAE